MATIRRSHWLVAAEMLLGLGLSVGCREKEPPSPGDAEVPVVQPAEPRTPSLPPQLLYLPDGGDAVLNNSPGVPAATPVPIPNAARNLSRRCPPEMVDVAGRFCIDRWEATLEDETSGRALSPYYSPDPQKAQRTHAQWKNERLKMGGPRARATSLPDLPEWQVTDHVKPMAVSRPGITPNGYMDGNSASAACERAGKRLCTPEEWTTACRGEARRQYPYGDHYEHGVCNVFRDTHPAVVLHDDASQGHMDPRLNQVQDQAGPLLRATGASTRCASTWGNDAIYDMVGNLDEWVDDGPGAFMGGFFARATRLGCDARIATHPKPYADYSLGVRCCK